MRRELGSFGKAQAITGENAPYNAVSVVGLSRTPNAAAIRTSLDGLTRLQPQLGARIVRGRGGRFFFETGTAIPEVPFRIIDRAREDSWKEAVELELQSRIPSEEGPLARCVLLAGRDPETPCELVLSLHHGAIDATSVLAAIRQVIEGHGDSAPAHRDEPIRAPELPPSADSRFPSELRQGFGRLRHLIPFMGRQMADELAFRRAGGHRRPVLDQDGRCRILTTALDETATGSLIRRSRRERVTMNSVINAALLQAVHRHLYDARSVALRYMIFPDLRPFLEPPIPAGASGSYSTIVRYSLKIRAGEEFWSLARRIHEQVHRSVRRGEKFLASMASPMMMKMAFRGLAGRMSTVAFSYTGPIPLPHQLGGFEIRFLHAFVSNFGVGPEYTGQVRLYRGRLQWDILYLDSDMDAAGAEVIARDILRRLREAGD